MGWLNDVKFSFKQHAQYACDNASRPNMAMQAAYTQDDDPHLN